MVRSGVDRWISPTLGTPPGRWTTDLLALLREIEGHLWAASPFADLDRKPKDYFEKMAEAAAKLHPGTTAESIKTNSISALEQSEAIVAKSIGQLQKMSFQILDADISQFDETPRVRSTIT